MTGYSDINCMSRINAESRRQPRTMIECCSTVVAKNIEKVFEGLCSCFSGASFGALKKVILLRSRNHKAAGLAR
jgi:hypothetical protein